jgi:hypothetical protein
VLHSLGRDEATTPSLIPSGDVWRGFPLNFPGC